MFYDNDALYKNTITQESVVKKKNNFIAYHRWREVVDDQTIRISNQRIEKNLSDMFTKIMT